VEIVEEAQAAATEPEPAPTPFAGAQPETQKAEGSAQGTAGEGAPGAATVEGPSVPPQPEATQRAAPPPEIVEEVVEEETYECPECGTPITPDMATCPNCGVGLTFEDGAE
jgi:hypothetical protein